MGFPGKGWGMGPGLGGGPWGGPRAGGPGKSWVLGPGLDWDRVGGPGAGQGKDTGSWASVGTGLGQDRGPGWGQGARGRELASHLLLPQPAPRARPRSVVMLPLLSLSSITTGLGLAAATKWGPRAPRVSPLGASVPAGPTSSAVTVPAVPLATGASPVVGVSTRGHGSGTCSPGGFLVEGRKRPTVATVAAVVRRRF